LKALVITNCATAAYTSGLRVLFPDWDVKGANSDIAQKWLGEEPHGAFQTFLSESDLLVLGSENESIFAEFTTGKAVLSIPYFYFRGLHPDSFHLGAGDRNVPSVLLTGNLHSRIAAVCYSLGLAQSEAVAAFNGRVYERIGYFSAFESARQNLLERFAKKEIDLAPAFERWRSTGNFLYTYNHPKAFVFNDILREALAKRFLNRLQQEQAHELLAPLPDYLDPSIRWPVYPEIAAYHRIDTDFLWRTGVNAGPTLLSLPDFIARSFEILGGVPGLGSDCIPGFAQCSAELGK
jgi:hypothetical protein